MMFVFVSLGKHRGSEPDIVATSVVLTKAGARSFSRQMLPGHTITKGRFFPTNEENYVNLLSVHSR